MRSRLFLPSDGIRHDLVHDPLAVRTDYYQTPDEYLAGERVSQEKHEYLAGVIYALPGTSIGHDRRIAGNIYRHLGNQLSGRPCEAFFSDVKVRIRKDAADFFIIRMSRSIARARVTRPSSPMS